MSKKVWIPWQMLSYSHFKKERDGYVIDVYSGKPSTWFICKDGVQVDCCYYHNPTNDEGSAKVQSEKCLDNLLNP